ncbi:hypothetical protein Tco_0399809 [Tanacetum coccineum]
MGKDSIQLEDAVSTISEEYLLEFTSEYGIPESLHPELPGPEETIVDFPKGKVGVYTKFFEFANYRILLSQFFFDILGHYQIHLLQLSVIGAAKQVAGEEHPSVLYEPLNSLKNWNNRFFWVDERIFPTVMEWRTNALKDGMPSADSYFAADVKTLNTRRTPIQKQPEALLCSVGLSRRYYLRDDVYPTFLYDDDRDMDLFNLISAPNPTKVKIGTRPRAAHKVLLLTVTANRVIDMENTIVASGSSETPSAIEKSPLDFANKDPTPLITKRYGEEEQTQDGLSHEIPPVQNPTTTEDVPEPDPEKESTLGGKSLAAMGLDTGSTLVKLATQETPSDAKSVSDPDLLSYAKPQPRLERDVAQSSRKTASEIPTKNVATAEAQDMFSVDSPRLGKSTSVPSMVGSSGVSISQVDMGSQLRLRFEQEVRLLKKAKAQIARRDQRIQMEKLKDTPIDLIMTSLCLVSDSGEDTPQWIRLAILLADAATQTQMSKDEASPRLLRSKSLPPMYDLDWP